jgi:hypothetical protein
MLALALVLEGRSRAEAARLCGMDRQTLRDKPKAPAGIVEGDETFILESFKGKRSDVPRKSRKRGAASAKRGLSAELGHGRRHTRQTAPAQHPRHIRTADPQPLRHPSHSIAIVGCSKHSLT